MLIKDTSWLAAGAIALISASAAHAQADQLRPGAEPATSPRPYPLRVESSMNINIPMGSASSPEEQIKQLAAARGFLYQAAAQDCDNLKQAFRADCKLTNVRVNSNIQTRGPAGETMYVNVSASYEVTIRPN